MTRTGVWIPAQIWEDRRLTATEKVLAAEIAAFTQRGSEYYKTNDTIAEDLNCSPSTVKRAVANLLKYGYLEPPRFDGRRRVLTAQIDPADRPKRPGSQVKKNRQTGQSDPADRSKRAQKKTESNTEKNTKQEKATVWPWPQSADVWTAWLDYKKKEHRFEYKSEHSAQAAVSQLLTLSNHDEQQARDIVRQSIANGWRGFFPLKRSGGAPAVPTTEDRDKFAQYIKTGTV